MMDRNHALVVGLIIVLGIAGGYWTLNEVSPRTPAAAGEGVGEADNLTVLDSRATLSGATIETVRTPANETYERIRYTREDRTYTVPHRTPLEPSLDWLRNNTPVDALIAAWWDYGHDIRGYADRDVVAYNPSQWVWEETTAAGQQGTSWDDTDKGALAADQRMQDLATILTTANATRAAALMAEYDASYLYLTAYDLSKYTALARTADQRATAQAINQLQCIRPANGAAGQCAVDTVNGTRYLGYQTTDGRRVFVPINGTGSSIQITGPARIEGGGTVFIPRACMTGGVHRFNVSDTAQTRPGCFAFHPSVGAQRFLYIPQPAMDTQLVQLYVMNTGSDVFERRYSDSRAHVWQLSTSALARATADSE